MIVYIEEDLNNQRLLSRMLAKYQAVVEFYEKADLAYIAIVKKRPDIIIINALQRSQQKYDALVRNLRQEGVRTPIIALVTYSIRANQHNVFLTGYDDFLIKPFAMQELRCTLEKHAPAIDLRVPVGHR